ncbi:hypothetical protein Xvie_00111 [Xenorhabdus vietnamensis]|uniref:Peptidase S1 domain-containing protein n=1 Tax=Xenorhabdus vietnamensis TaxID=351656 RepID=A0A1Y2SJU1_9GAMM|nr:trypsin-like serine protease [Xenorhabdus vietnamensis]OTA18292.1 hypothetical protein Xvie_00111 [Xenorhabdus vietnamensis]
MKNPINILIIILLATISGKVIAADNPPNSANALSYVKLDFSYNLSKQKFTNRCGGTLIADDLVLTASHCLNQQWINANSKELSIYYGKEFIMYAGLHSGKSWVQFDPEVDLAIIQLDRKIDPNSGAIVAKLDAPCPSGPKVKYPLRAIFYQRMDDDGKSLPLTDYQTTTTYFETFAKSELANGYAYLSRKVGNAGDSGSSVFSKSNILIGVMNGNSDYTHCNSAAVCFYRDRIDAESKKLHQNK